MTTRPTRRTPLAVAVFFLATSGIVFAACNTDVPTAAQIRDADASTVTQTLGLPEGDGVRYFVDGKPVSAAIAKSVTAGDIETINVSGGVGERGAASLSARGAEVRIVTRGYASGSGDVTSAGTTDSMTPLARILSDSQVVAIRRRGDSSSIVMGALMRDRDSSEMLLRIDGDEVAFMADSNDMRVLRRPVNGRQLQGQPQMLLRGSDDNRAAAPLVVIDGVISTLGDDALRNINPSSIETIEVVKGNAAVSLYGSRGANGVISITSKKVKQQL